MLTAGQHQEEIAHASHSASAGRRERVTFRYIVKGQKVAEMCFVLSMVLVALVSNDFKDMCKCMQMLARRPGINIHWLPKRGQWSSLPTMLVYLDCQCLQHHVGEPTQPPLTYPPPVLFRACGLYTVRLRKAMKRPWATTHSSVSGIGSYQVS